MYAFEIHDVLHSVADLPSASFCLTRPFFFLFFSLRPRQAVPRIQMCVTLSPTAHKLKLFVFRSGVSGLKAAAGRVIGLRRTACLPAEFISAQAAHCQKTPCFFQSLCHLHIHCRLSRKWVIAGMAAVSPVRLLRFFGGGFFLFFLSPFSFQRRSQRAFQRVGPALATQSPLCLWEHLLH